MRPHPRSNKNRILEYEPSYLNLGASPIYFPLQQLIFFNRDLGKLRHQTFESRKYRTCQDFQSFTSRKDEIPPRPSRYMYFGICSIARWRASRLSYMLVLQFFRLVHVNPNRNLCRLHIWCRVYSLPRWKSGMQACGRQRWHTFILSRIGLLEKSSNVGRPLASIENDVGESWYCWNSNANPGQPCSSVAYCNFRFAIWTTVLRYAMYLGQADLSIRRSEESSSVPLLVIALQSIYWYIQSDLKCYPYCINP